MFDPVSIGASLFSGGSGGSMLSGVGGAPAAPSGADSTGAPVYFGDYGRLPIGAAALEPGFAGNADVLRVTAVAGLAAIAVAVIVTRGRK